MKNNLVIIIFIYILFSYNSVFSASFTFQSKNIKIINNGEQVNAGKGRAISSDGNLEIESDEFIYVKSSDTLKSIGSGELIVKSKKIKIKYDTGIFDQKNLIFTASGNVEVFQTDGIFVINTNKIFFNQKENILLSDETTKIEDNIGNTYFLDSFKFEVNKNLLKVKNLLLKDPEQNIFETPLAYINTNSGKIFGKDISIELKNQTTQNNGNYRLKGTSGTIEKNRSTITKGVFTNCKKSDGCPPWTFSAKKITHNKNKKEISYDNALLKVYNLPLIYFPKFFHPDPTVKRKSGFLIPSINNSSNSNNFINIPYYLVIAENQDVTLSPRLYVDNKFLIQSEFRQKNFRSNHVADISFLTEKNKDSENHIFYNYDKNLILDDFDTSEINFKLQKTSNSTYLKSNNLKSELNNEMNIMENSFNLDLYSNDFSINFETAAYENLNKNDNDRFEYIFPKLFFSKNLDSVSYLDGNFRFETDGLIRQYNTNILEKHLINNLIFNSTSKINRLGFLNNYEFMIRNTNSENKKSLYKNNRNHYLSGIYQYNTILPLIKDGKFYQNIFKPRVSARIAPEHTKDEKNKERKVDLTNIYSLDRITDGSSIEGGLSLTYGMDYSISEKLKTKELVNFKLANNLKIKNNDDVSNTNSIGEKTSDIFSEISYSPTDSFFIKYVSAIKNNLSEINYENLTTQIKIKNFLTTFDYFNENNTVNSNSYISNTTSYNLNKSNNLIFSTRKNKTRDLTEYYNLMYQYKIDCLAASIEYKKDYYSDKELKPNESMQFKLTIMPFAEITGPNL